MAEVAALEMSRTGQKVHQDLLRRKLARWRIRRQCRATRGEEGYFARLLKMLERRGSSYTMEAEGENQFKMADTTVGDWIEISAPVLGEHLLFLVKESHQLRQRVAVRDEQLLIVSGRGIEFNQNLNGQENEITVAHAHKDISIKEAQVARKLWRKSAG